MMILWLAAVYDAKTVWVITLPSAANGHLSECPSKNPDCKWVSVTCMSALWHFIKCTGKVLIQVLFLTAKSYPSPDIKNEQIWSDLHNLNLTSAIRGHYRHVNDDLVKKTPLKFSKDDLEIEKFNEMFERDLIQKYIMTSLYNLHMAKTRLKNFLYEFKPDYLHIQLYRQLGISVDFQTEVFHIIILFK